LYIFLLIFDDLKVNEILGDGHLGWYWACRCGSCREYWGNRQQTFQSQVDVAFEDPARVAEETATRTSPHHVKQAFWSRLFAASFLLLDFPKRHLESCMIPHEQHPTLFRTLVACLLRGLRFAPALRPSNADDAISHVSPSADLTRWKRCVHCGTRKPYCQDTQCARPASCSVMAMEHQSLTRDSYIPTRKGSKEGIYQFWRSQFEDWRARALPQLVFQLPTHPHLTNRGCL